MHQNPLCIFGFPRANVPRLPLFIHEDVYGGAKRAGDAAPRPRSIPVFAHAQSRKCTLRQYPVFSDSSLSVMPWWFRNARMGPFPRIMSRATSWGTRTPSSASWAASMSLKLAVSLDESVVLPPSQGDGLFASHKPPSCVELSGLSESRARHV